MKKDIFELTIEDLSKVVDEHGNTSAHNLAMNGGLLAILKCKEENFDEYKEFIENVFPIKNNHGRTVAHNMAWMGVKFKDIEILMKEYINFTIELEVINDDTGETLYKTYYPSTEMLEMDINKINQLIEEEKERTE